MTNQPNPVRTLTSHGIEDQNSEDWRKRKSCDRQGDQHHMISVKTNSALVPYVEQCTDCSWIDGASLEWWAENAIKSNGTQRAQRIAVAAESEPFRFAQPSDGDLSLSEILGQALGAASMCWETVGGTFDSSRAAKIVVALQAEVRRFQRLAIDTALHNLLAEIKPE